MRQTSLPVKPLIRSPQQNSRIRRSGITVLGGLENLSSHQGRAGAAFRCSHGHDFKVNSKYRKLERHDILWLSGRMKMSIITIFIL
jgi:hypothetical protein